jgi:hypothetical protein
LSDGQAGAENLDFVVGPETFFGGENLDGEEGGGKNLRPNNIDYSVEWRKKPKGLKKDVAKIKIHYLKYLRRNLEKFKTLKPSIRENSAMTNIIVTEAPEEVVDSSGESGLIVMETQKYTVPEFDWGGSEQSGELARVSVMYSKSSPHQRDSLEPIITCCEFHKPINIYASLENQAGGSIRVSPLKPKNHLKILNSEGSSPLNPELSEIGEQAFYGNFEFEGSYNDETPEEERSLEPDWNANEGLFENPGLADDQCIDAQGSQDFLEDGSPKSKKKSRDRSPGSKLEQDEKSVASSNKSSKRNSLNKSKYQIARLKKSAYGNQYSLPTHPLYSHDRIC